MLTEVLPHCDQLFPTDDERYANGRKDENASPEMILLLGNLERLVVGAFAE